jgi:Putative bacterial sensory transduction regulator
MPRYRFSWDNLPPGLLRQLGSDLRLRPPVDQALRERYGARPEQNFVRDAWPTLIKAWLETDDESRELVVDELQARGLGKARAPAVSAASQLYYLRSCRNSSALREAVAAIFTAFGESEDFPTPVPSETTAEDNPIVTPDWQPSDSGGQADQPPTSLTEWLGWAVAQILQVDQVNRDPDGDIRIRYGSTMCFVRGIEDPPSVRLFAPMVIDIPQTPALLADLNDINLNITVGRVVHTPANEVLFSLELYGEQLTVEIIRASLDAATTIADHFDHQLQSRFGGKTLYAEVSDDSVMM